MVKHNVLCDFDMKCCDLAGTLAEGDYTFPFQFKMYDEAPASIIFQKYSHRDHPIAIVRWELEATLKTTGGDAKYAQFLIV